MVSIFTGSFIEEYAVKKMKYIVWCLVLLCTQIFISIATADINASYYDQNGQSGAYFTGIEINRVDANIDFNWGGREPLTGVGRDDFSVRWDGLVQVPADGAYTFRVRGDDGIRIWVDGNLLVSDWSNHGPRNRDSSPVNLLSSQLYSIVVEHYERGGGAVAQVSWSGPTSGGFQIIPAGNLFVNNNPPQVTSAAYGCGADSITIDFDKNLDPTTAEDINNYSLDNGASIFSASLDPSGRNVILQTSALTEDTYVVTINNIQDSTGNVIGSDTTVSASFAIFGLSATYYDQNNVAGNYFSGSIVERLDPVVDFNWGSGSPATGIGNDRFSVRWLGSVVALTTDDYQFRTRSDDGVRLWVDDVLVIDNWTDHGATYNTTTNIPLVAGQQYSIRMEYYENGGGAVAQLQWQNSGFGWQTIPQAQLRGTCGLPSFTLVAEYKFDLCDWEATGIATDSVGGFDGVVSGGIFRDTNATSGIKPETCSSAGFSGGAIDIAGLPLSTATGDQTSVSFWMYWDGTNSVMPLGWDRHDLWFNGGSFGFNSAAGDIYGISSAGLANGWHHVVAVFTNNNLTANQMYIDGVLQVLTQRRGTPSNTRAVVDSQLRLGGWRANNGYRFSGRLDEVKVYDGMIDQSQVDADVAYFTSVCPNCPPPPPPPPATLIAEYGFDDDWDTSGSLLDSVGGLNGVQTGAVTRVATPAQGAKRNTCFGGQFNGGAFDINNLPVSTTSGDKTSISFWMYWDGSNSVMPLGWNRHDLWFYGGNFGFNSAAGDIYGVSSAGLANSWHHVSVVFTNNRMTSNKIYIDGVEQVLTQRRGSPNNTSAVVNPRLRIGGWWANNGYRFRGILDEIKVYTGEISDAQVLADMDDDCLDPNGQWTFEESSWTGAANEVLDSAGGGLHGTALGFNTGPANPRTLISDPAVAGSPGTCRYGEFDGVDDYIEISDSSALDDTSQITLSAWFKADSLTQTNGTNARGLFSKRPSFSNNVSYGVFFLNGGSNRLYVDISGTDNRFRSNTSFSVDRWYHIAIVFDGSQPASQRVRLYVDGALDGAFNESSTRIDDTDSNFYIGNLYTGLSELKVFDGAIDEVNIIPLALTASEVTDLMNETRPCAVVPVFLDINTNGSSASTCLAQLITIRACEDLACTSLVNDYNGTVDITVSTDHGDWSVNAGSSTLTDTVSDDGAASYAFDDVNDGGSVDLDLLNTHAETVTISVEDAALGVSATSVDLTFGDNVFVIDHGDDLHIAGRDQSMTASMYTNDGSNCAVNTLYSGNKNLKVWLDRDVADPSGAAPIIDSTAVPDNSSTTFNINFVSGVASFDFATSDVGKYLLNIVDDTLLFSDQLIVGDTPITTRPFGFNLQVNGNAGAVDASGGVFTVAGSDFAVRVNAVTWEAVDDVDNDGVPDGHVNASPGDNADLSNNATAVSFGLEGAGQTESVALVAYEYSPNLIPSVSVLEDGGAGCSNCIVGSFSSGIGLSGNVHYDNVGIIEVQAALVDGSYLGSDTVIGASGYVGRFIPDHFELQNSSMTPADTSSSPYTYMGQEFLVDYDLIAVNALGQTTDNYQGAYAKLVIDDVGAFGAVGSSVDVAYGAINVPGTELTSRLAVGSVPPSTNWVDGVISVIDLPMTINKGVGFDGPYASTSIGMNVEDSDGVTFNSLNLEVDAGNAGIDALQLAGSPGELRYGRAFFPPVYGPEISVGETLDIPFVNQYWNGLSFVTNIDDNITSYENWGESCTDPDTGDGLICTEASRTIADLTNAVISTVIAGEDDENYPITINRPGLGNNGSLDIRFDLIGYDWLQFDWNGTGDEGPTTRINFGRYRGHDRIIYWREKTN
jgi:MSHA biogenesis protein MshQ